VFLEPLTRNNFEAISGSFNIRCLLSLSVFAWIYIVRQLLPRNITTFAGILQPNIRIYTHRQGFALSSKAIIKTPPL